MIFVLTCCTKATEYSGGRRVSCSVSTTPTAALSLRPRAYNRVMAVLTLHDTAPPSALHRLKKHIAVIYSHLVRSHQHGTVPAPGPNLEPPVVLRPKTRWFWDQKRKFGWLFHGNQPSSSFYQVFQQVN